MHYHLEVVLPPVSDVQSAISSIMAPFNECPDDTNQGDLSSYRFWDFYVIGGRWAGDKLEKSVDQTKLTQFKATLDELKITVSGFRAGKPKLNPESQINTVDALWRDYFPESKFSKCPLFSHSNDQYDSASNIVGDICELKDVPANYEAEKVIIASFGFDGGLRPEFMAQRDFWNGVNYVDTKWDGMLQSAVVGYREKIKNYREEWIEKNFPRENWLSVTVDYHS